MSGDRESWTEAELEEFEKRIEKELDRNEASLATITDAFNKSQERLLDYFNNRDTIRNSTLEKNQIEMQRMIKEVREEIATSNKLTMDRIDRLEQDEKEYRRDLNQQLYDPQKGIITTMGRDIQTSKIYWKIIGAGTTIMSGSLLYIIIMLLVH